MGSVNSNITEQVQETTGSRFLVDYPRTFQEQKHYKHI